MHVSGQSEIREFREKYSIPHSAKSIYTEVFNEQKTANFRAKKKFTKLSEKSKKIEIVLVDCLRA